MLFLITLLIFLVWAVYVIHKKRISSHALFGIYCGTLVAVDIGDVLFDYWLDLYDIPTRLLRDHDACDHLGLILSDGLIFPLIAIVFCYYSVRYHRPWLLSLGFAAMLGIIELIYVKLGFMVYHHWHHWTTPCISFLAFRALAGIADRLVDYNPPFPYSLRLFCAVYAITGWPAALFSGILQLYKFTPVLARDTANDPFFSIIQMVGMGLAAAVLIPKTAQRHRLILCLGLGAVSFVFSLWLHSVGLIQYVKWHHLWMALVNITPFLVVWLYDRWEDKMTWRRPKA